MCGHSHSWESEPHGWVSPDKGAPAKCLIQGNAIRNAARPDRGQTPMYQKAAKSLRPSQLLLFTYEPLDNICQHVWPSVKRGRLETVCGKMVKRESKHGSFTYWSMEIKSVSRFNSGKTQRVSALSDTGQQFSRTNEGESMVIVWVWHIPQRLIRNLTPLTF